MNAVTLIGKLASDVEVREVGDAKKVANFLLAVERPPGRQGADFIRITAWDRQAEVCAQFLATGRRVAVDGRLRSSSWQDADGNKRTTIEVVARLVEFLSGPNQEANAAETRFEAAAVA